VTRLTGKDAPALDSLAKYNITEKDGRVYVTGNEKELKGNWPESLSLKCKASGAENVVVVGGYDLVTFKNCTGI
jgi:hypothetical protein